MSSEAAVAGMSSWPAFTASRYKSDGGFTLKGLVTLTILSCLTGAAVGLLAGLISQWFFMVLIFPLGMGLIIGAAGNVGVKAGKVRMPLVCGTAGFLGGCVAVAAMHGCEFYQFERELGEVPPEIRALARNYDQLQPRRQELEQPVQEVLAELAKDPAARQALAVNGLFSFIDLKAKQGVEISSGRGGGKGMNLGYIGSYVYWGFELLLIAGVAFAMMQGAAAEPFCAGCGSWKISSVAGAFLGPASNLKESLEQGDLTSIHSQAGEAGDNLVATVFQCPQCGPEAPIEVRFDKVTINAKGEASTKSLCTATYPGEALEPVTQLFAAAQAKAAPPEAESVEEPETPPSTPES